MMAIPLAALRNLEIARKSRCLVYCASDHLEKPLSSGDAVIFLEMLRNTPKSEQLDLVINTPGGSLSAAYRIACMLRNSASKFNVLVPRRARSAGTMICLSADNIVLGPQAELGPLDPYLSSGKDSGKEVVQKISSEEIRAYKAMARSWFGVNPKKFSLELLELVSRSIFPSSLAGLYRAEEYTMKLGIELLSYQLPRSSASRRGQIVRSLISDYFEHSHSLGVKELRKLGLRATEAEMTESRLLNETLREAQKFLASIAATPNGGTETSAAVLFSTDYVASFVASSGAIRRENLDWLRVAGAPDWTFAPLAQTSSS